MRSQRRLDKTLEGVAKAVGGRLLSFTNAIEAGTCRAYAGRPGREGIPLPLPMQPPAAMRIRAVDAARGGLRQCDALCTHCDGGIWSVPLGTPERLTPPARALRAEGGAGQTAILRGTDAFRMRGGHCIAGSDSTVTAPLGFGGCGEAFAGYWCGVWQ